MRIILLSTIVLMLSCTSYPHKVSKVKIGDGSSFVLLEPENWEPLSALQKVTVSWGEHTLSFNVQLEIDKDGIKLVGLTPVYSRSFMISYFNGHINFEEHPYFKYPVRPENMMADFQMAFSSPDIFSIDSGVVKHSSMLREIFSNNKKLISISYSDSGIWKSTVTLKNHQQNYSLKIQTLEFEKL